MPGWAKLPKPRAPSFNSPHPREEFRKGLKGLDGFIIIPNLSFRGADKRDQTEARMVKMAAVVMGKTSMVMIIVAMMVTMPIGKTRRQ